MSAAGDEGPRWRKPSVVIAAGLLVLGLGSLGGLAYADLTTTVTQAEYDEFTSDCERLENETELAETGIGRDPVELNQSTVEWCQNLSYEEYRQAQVDSLRAAPLNPWQWALYGGFGLAIAVAGAVLLRQELRAGR